MSDMRNSVAEMFDKVERLLHNLAFASGLNPAQWSALRYLSGAEDGARTVTAFARHHRTTKPAASKTIDALVRKSLVRKLSIPGDRRAQRLDLTGKAQKRLAQDPRNLLRKAVGSLGRSDMAVLARSLEAVADGIDAGAGRLHKANGKAGRAR